MTMKFRSKSKHFTNLLELTSVKTLNQAKCIILCVCVCVLTPHHPVPTVMEQSVTTVCAQLFCINVKMNRKNCVVEKKLKCG